MPGSDDVYVVSGFCNYRSQPLVNGRCPDCQLQATHTQNVNSQLDKLTIQMAHANMVEKLVKSGETIRAQLTAEQADLWHMGTGAATEGGELLDAIKKYVVYQKPIDRANVIEELGDIEFFVERIRKIIGVTREEVLQANLDKLLTGKNARYADGVYSDAAAHARADKL